ncbi:hypothetical protein J6590_023857 [Homalodisca vitripennis]|nr:hypothetical protein J6590_023857 [Homalodisca vitripennis]
MRCKGRLMGRLLWRMTLVARHSFQISWYESSSFVFPNWIKKVANLLRHKDMSPLPALTGEASRELASPSSKET